MDVSDNLFPLKLTHFAALQVYDSSGLFFCQYHKYHIICLNIGTSTTIKFAFGTNGKLIVLGDPILKHIWVYVGSSCDY